jgi:hypothetical protein
MKTYWGCEGIAPRIFYLDTRWRWVVRFTHLPLYPQGKNPRYPLDRRLGGPQSWSGRGGEEKNSQPQSGLEPPNPDHPARCQSLYRLSHPGSSVWYRDINYFTQFIYIFKSDKSVRRPVTCVWLCYLASKYKLVTEYELLRVQYFYPRKNKLLCYDLHSTAFGCVTG